MAALNRANVGAGDDARLHAEADQAARELVHDQEHSAAPEHDRLASKEVDAPEAVGGVADERQPRGPSSARSRAIVFGQHTVHHVLVDIDPERLHDDPRCRPRLSLTPRLRSEPSGQAEGQTAVVRKYSARADLQVVSRSIDVLSDRPRECARLEFFADHTHGNAGIPGIAGNVDCVTCRI
jgi:hypothetical protein